MAGNIWPQFINILNLRKYGVLIYCCNKRRIISNEIRISHDLESQVENKKWHLNHWTFLQQNLDVCWNGPGTGVTASSPDQRLHYFEPSSFLSLHQFMRWICLQASANQRPVFKARDHSRPIRRCLQTSAGCSAASIVISNKIALLNNSSSRIYPLHFSACCPYCPYHLARLCPHFQSGGRPPCPPRPRPVPRATWASPRSVSASRTTRHTSATTPWPARRISRQGEYFAGKLGKTGVLRR